MKSDIWIGKKGYRYWYYRYRDSQYYSLSIVGFATVVSLVLLFYVVIPELSNWFSIQQEVDTTQQQIAILQQNISFINSLDKTQLDSQLQTASHALPPEKDFGSVLQAVGYAAAKSNVSLNNYSFQIGTIKTASTLPGIAVSKVDTTPIQIVVVVNGSFDNLVTFMKDLQNNLPLATVIKVDGSGSNLSMTLQFYQKPFPKIVFSGTTPLTQLTANDNKLLQQLSQWDHTADIPSLSTKAGTSLDKTTHVYTVTSSGSANLTPLF